MVLSAALLVGLSPSFANASGVYETDNAIHDTRMIAEKSTSKVRSSDSIALFSFIQSNPVNTSNVSIFKIPPMINATATSKSTTKEDFIEARVRAYNSSGGLWDKAVKDTQQRSEYAGATKKTGTGWISFAYGNHVYKLSGYKDVYHETYSK